MNWILRPCVFLALPPIHLRVGDLFQMCPPVHLSTWYFNCLCGLRFFRFVRCFGCGFGCVLFSGRFARTWGVGSRPGKVLHVCIVVLDECFVRRGDIAVSSARVGQLFVGRQCDCSQFA
jgi:hypothetical protein